MNVTMSAYYLKLQAENVDVANRYKQKINIIKNMDPFAMEEKQFSCNPVDFPQISNMDIVTYLVLTTSFYTKQQMKAYKSLSSFKYFKAGFVSNCGVFKMEKKNIIVGKVKHSQKLNSPPLKVWVIVEEDGGINTGHCTCMAGLGEVCSHIGAILYSIEFIVTSYQQQSCTDIPALWKVPGVAKVEYKPLNEIDFERLYIMPAISKKIKPLNNDEISSLLYSVKDAGTSSVLMRVVEPFASDLMTDVEENVCPENYFKFLYREEYENYSLKMLIQLANMVSINLSEEDCRKIREATLEQSSSDLWFQQRTGRITASLFKQATKTSTLTPSLSLIKRICYPLNFVFKTKACEWGKKHEKDALMEYSKEQSMTHQELKLKKVGLCIDRELPHFGASPDSLVVCDCCGEGCVEVKCPYLLRNITIEEFSKIKTSCLIFTTEAVYLDANHSYYYQIQQQMAITKTSFCDFVIWSPRELFIERIPFNEDFWFSESRKSSEFHKKVILPELLGKAFTKSDELTGEKYCFCSRIDDGSAMIACDNDNCTIQWFHLHCLGIDEIPEILWLCPLCRVAT